MASWSPKQSGTAGYSWKLCACAAIAAVIAAIISFGSVSPIVTGLILLTAVGWGYTARDNKKALEEEQNPSGG
ncbi:MAG: hypothetical protein B7X58_12890 [Marinobacter sp. 34-60-7]|nr:MAG: hypothetical protein B7X58_12890 [Marinobacter sp. 34-60-7]